LEQNTLVVVPACCVTSDTQLPHTLFATRHIQSLRVVSVLFAYLAYLYTVMTVVAFCHLTLTLIQLASM